MIAYHISRTNTLSVGQTINLLDSNVPLALRLFDGKVSRHGENYAATCCGPDFTSHWIEYEFELVRRALFPKMISRYQSFFALESIPDILYWHTLLDPKTPYKVYEIEFHHEHYQKLDASFLVGGPDLNEHLYWNPSTDLNHAINYWNGITSPSPLPELLILPPITVVAEKHLTIGLT